RERLGWTGDEQTLAEVVELMARTAREGGALAFEGGRAVVRDQAEVVELEASEVAVEEAAVEPQPIEELRDGETGVGLPPAQFPIYRVPVSQIKADPKRFQFKEEVNEEGVQQDKDLRGEWNE